MRQSVVRVGLFLPLLALASLVAGAAKTKTIEVTYVTDIPGATLYENERAFGMTPITLKYQLQEGCTNVRPLTVRWPSGAEASVSALTVCTKTGKKQHFSFNRPLGFPGREVDAQFALQLAQAAAQRQQASAAYWLALSESLRVPPPAQAVHCTSNVIGNQVFTTCR